VNVDTQITHKAVTNDDGLFNASGLLPGNYRIEVAKSGFKTVIKPDIVLHVQDVVAINFKMILGSVTESVTVEGGAPLVNAQDASVSTVVDRNFAENLPMNGRSFQTLIQLTPGVVLTTTNYLDGGQFSVNGQRATSNYWMVDGVSANIGISATVAGNPGNVGSLGSFSTLGGTNSLVSVDAMQEFRIQTSTYAPEFGRTPGGQISIVTRSGTSQFHGTAFEYLRNDLFDASDWFADSLGLRKPEERQNDFGGTFSGPIVKDRTFFFFSYEGLRLRLPQTILTTVPDLSARNNAIPAIRPYLNAFPLPNGTDNAATGIAQFNANFSNPASLDAYSLRIDHKLSNKWSLFGRYNYSPSSLAQSATGISSVSTVNTTKITTTTTTLGTIWLVSPTTSSDLRFNYSQTHGSNSYIMNSLGGAVPLASSPFPSPFTSQESLFSFFIRSVKNGALYEGVGASNRLRQINLVEALSMQRGPHALKLGADFRRLSPSVDPPAYFQSAQFSAVTSAENGNLLRTVLQNNFSATLLFRNLGIFAQDTWQARSRLTVTYGIRWDVDFVPVSLKGPNFVAVTGFDLTNLQNLALAPSGTKPYSTTYGNFAPRLGANYQLSQRQDTQTVIRGGFGVFYDLGSSQGGGSALVTGAYPFSALKVISGGTFPLDPAQAAPPPITPASASGSGFLGAFDPHFSLPYTLQWNVALEQALGMKQEISVSYLGAAGRRLIQTALVFSPNSNIGSAYLTTNLGTSDYNALQVQFQRRLSRGLQALASYTWSHSIDTASAGSATGNVSNALTAGLDPNINRGPSDFDIRNAFSCGITYDVPAPRIDLVTRAFLSGWSIQSIIQGRSAPPVDVADARFFEFNGGIFADIRPDLVPGQPLYLYGPQYPGRKAFNPGAFTDPPVDPKTGNPLRQGTLPRNALRGFGATQWDFAVHRDFPVHESRKLQFRAEMFNVLNHPNFGPPRGQFGFAGFGLSNQMLGASFNHNSLGGGGLSPLYQIGGPRSIQFALKLMF
jgi:hypothetical protein